VLPTGVVRIEFDKENFTYECGQYVFVCFPAISVFEWHPFSISTSPHDKHVSVHIRVLGNWTAAVAKLALTCEKLPPGSELPKIYVDGPYGELSYPRSEYKNFLLISGGIGITPLQSIFNGLVHDWRAGHQQLRHCAFVWSVREGASYTYLLEDQEYLSHKQHNNLGVFPPFHTPMLLQDYEVTRMQTSEQPSNEQPYIKAHFYLTSSHTLNETDKGLQAVTTLDSNAPSSQTWIQRGRPNLDEIFSKVLAQHGGEKRCAVMVCGPNSLVRAVRASCARHSSKESGIFDLHEESFEF